ncbi:MAG: bifunctional phosphoribosylaminoimidazolecarboxamide formyltransferase/IMP cyclohydrolase [Tissierellia bacterium]|nr:bifunctional phosphoribosylaminoimidazolecarboxamide formyltransferase/IMP cyclohydrolase [Tissierellia bacterium]
MKHALISVTNKEGIVEFARKLVENNYKIISTGGTLKVLEEGKVPVTGIEEYTKFPEILDGRVKTLHPKVHGGLLFKRDTREHVNTIEELDITPIDMVVVNLYRFEESYKEGKSQEEIIESIDIGGPSMIRSAAKNFKDVLVVTDPLDYDEVVKKIEDNSVDKEYREYLAMKAFSLTAYYDSMISRYFMETTMKEGPYFSFGLKLEGHLRYGENPHQNAKLYKDGFVDSYYSNMEQIQGKELSFNNLNDLNTAVELAGEYSKEEGIICVALKHATPCGVGLGGSTLEAYEKAFEGDPLSIFGGVLAFNDVVDGETAKKMTEIFLEVIAAPDFTDEALSIFKEKNNLRLLKIDVSKERVPFDMKYVSGKVLFQESDRKTHEDFSIVTKKKPTTQEEKDLSFGMKVCKYARSNAIVIVKDGMTLGVGGGQTSRIWALESIFNNHPERDFSGAVLASDAFFPFDDVVKAAKKKGITSIIQPGGSIRDEDSIKACDEAGISMVFTGVRHFRH